MLFHVDANSFYASCERVFRPDLAGKPIAVLSNNDGITIALNQECKDLGFRRGDTYFKMKAQYAAKGVAVFSSNYTLYADMSRRLNLLYAGYTPDVELYSIDESFLYFPDCRNVDYTALAHEIKETAQRTVHIPVSVGIAPTKTLAKLCNKLAKKSGGVWNWNECDQEKTLAAYPAGDIWNIGESKRLILERMGITTALGLARMLPGRAKQYLSVNGWRTVQELNGIPAIDRNESEKRDNITASRSFSRGVASPGELETAIAEYAQLAVTRMRTEGSACRAVSVYLMTARAYRPEDKEKEYFNGAFRVFDRSTSYLPDIQNAAAALMKSVYRSGYQYRKVMVNLLALEPDRETQGDLFHPEYAANREKNKALMSVCDSINARYGRGCIHTGMRMLTKEISADGTRAAWKMNRSMLSPAYTTDIAALPEVK